MAATSQLSCDNPDTQAGLRYSSHVRQQLNPGERLRLTILATCMVHAPNKPVGAAAVVFS